MRRISGHDSIASRELKTMAKHTTPSPLAELKKRFGSREALIGELVKLLDHEGAERALKSTTNAKLLTLYGTATMVKRRFGGRAGLVEAVTKLTYPSGNVPPAFAESVQGYNMKRLVDLHDKASNRLAKTKKA